MASSSSSSSPHADTCLNFITHLLKSLKHALINVFFHEQKLEEEDQFPQAISSSPSSSRQMKHQVFLSFRGEDTRLNFTAHLLKALKDTGMNVFFDEEKLEKGEQLSPALSRAIAASNLSVIVLSKGYASSKSCLAEVSDIMDRNDTQGHTVLPIFYHVDPSIVRNIDGSFKTSFEEHESKRLPQIQRWKAAFTGVGKLKGWHIEGSKFDRPETEYIKDIVEYVIKKLMNNYSKSVSEELVGIDDQKNMILRLIEREDSRIIGLWGMGGIGKTTLAEAVYKEVLVSLKFEDGCFLQNVNEKIEKQGMESLRNDFLSELLSQEIRIRTPSIRSSFIQERLNNKRVMVVLDDVHDSDQIDYMGVEHFGRGSKIIITSRDRQVLINGGVEKIHGVNKLNENDSLQLFSTFAFKQLNPMTDFLDLSKKFVEYAQGNPLGLKVLGSQLYKKSRRDWESEVDKLKEYGQPKISQILKRSFDGLDELEKNIFLDVVCFFKRELKDDVEEILSCCYMGAVCGINNLVDKCLLDITILPGISMHHMLGFQCISMHDLLEEMGKDIVRQESKVPGKRSRLWTPKDVYQVLKYNKGTNSIEGIKLDIAQIHKLWLCPTSFQNMLNLRFIIFFSSNNGWESQGMKLLANGVDILSLPDELRYLCWEYYPFRSLSSSFNPKNLIVLKLPYSDMEQLWNEDNHQSAVNLREIHLNECKNLRKIPNLKRAAKLEILDCNGCQSLVELPCLNHLTSLERLDLQGCRNLRQFPQVPNHFPILKLSETRIEEVPDSIEQLILLERLYLENSRVKKLSSNISKLESLESLDLSHCPLVEFPEIPGSLTGLSLCGTEIEEVASFSDCLCNSRCLDMSSSSIQKLQCNVPLIGSREIPTIDVPSSMLRFKSLRYLKMSHCKSLKVLSELPPYLRYLNAHDCTSLEKVSFACQNQHLYEFHSFDGEYDFFMVFSNCLSLNQDSVDNIEANVMIKIGSLAEIWKWASKNDYGPDRLFCCFAGNEISANRFEYQSVKSSLTLQIAPEGHNRRRFLVFSICLVADLRHCHGKANLQCLCEYQLTAAGSGGYEKFKTEWFWSEPDYELEPTYMGDHVFILFNRDMVKKDKDYEVASFKFSVNNLSYSVNGTRSDHIRVEKCGVHVSYVDEESSPNPQNA